MHESAPQKEKVEVFSGFTVFMNTYNLLIFQNTFTHSQFTVTCNKHLSLFETRNFIPHFYDKKNPPSSICYVFLPAVSPVANIRAIKREAWADIYEFEITQSARGDCARFSECLIRINFPLKVLPEGIPSIAIRLKLADTNRSRTNTSATV